MGKNNINILVFARDYPVGQAGTKRVQQLLDYLLIKDISINVISYRSKYKQPSIEGTYQGIHFLNIGSDTDMKLRHFHKVVLYFLTGFNAIFHNKKRKSTNIVYCAGGISIENFLFVGLAKLLGYKLILAIEEDYDFFDGKLKMISTFKLWTIKRLDFLNSRWASAIVVISTYLVDKYQKRTTKPVVHVPITARINFDKDKKEFNHPLQVLYAGTFADKDGVKDIINGFMIFNKSFHDAQLILTGKSEQQILFAEKFRNYKNVIFKGYIPDNEFYPLLKNADVLCMCRTGSGFANAGFPFKLGEYLATGNPVISTKVSDVENYLSSEDAYLIEPNSPQQICSSLNEIVVHPEEARKIGLNGLKKCQEFFSQEKNGRILYDLIIKISFGKKVS
jgi:glycosyltransferase involved in cell wall biosynthesis